MNQARITELYEGVLGTGPESRVGRRRVHWICSQCSGDDILDLGCGQGIVSILLAREGKTVTGVDRETGAIEYARQRLKEEEEAVQQRLDFILTRANTLPFDSQSFDTVFLGRLVDQLVDQRTPLREARRVLRLDGRLVVTTPYGVVPDHEYMEPQYLAGLAELLLPDFEIEQVELIDSYLGIVGRARAGSGASAPAQLLPRFLEVAERRLAAQDESVSELRSRVEKLEAERIRLARQLDRRDRQLDQSLSRATELQEEASAVKSELRWANAEAKGSARRAEQAAMRLESISRQARALTAIRGSRSYRVIRAVWQLNSMLHRRAPRASEREESAARDRFEALDWEADRRALLVGHGGGSRDERRVEAPSTLRVAAIVDPWLGMALGASCQLITFRPDNWPHLLDAQRPDLLLVQSAWRGNDGSWEYRVPRYTHPDAGGLGELVDWCRARDVPTVFWHTEGANEVSTFSRSASLFDLVVAASAGVAERLTGQLGDERAVSVLPLAAQPLVHRPDSEVARHPAVALVGDCSQGGRESVEALLQGGASHPLEIFHTGREPAVPELLPHLSPYTSHRKLVQAFQSMCVILAGSPLEPAFIPGDIFEALSCGATVVSAPNPEVSSLLGEVVPIASTPEEAASHLDRLLRDDEHRLATLRQARRLILSSHTYQHRLSEIARAAGRQDAVWSPPTVAVLAVLESRRDLDSFLKQLAEQSRRPDELVIAFENGDSPDGLPGVLEDMKVSFEPAIASSGERSLAETSRRLCQRTSSQWISWFDRKRRYEPDHLATLVESTFYTDAVVAVARSESSIAGDGSGESSVTTGAEPDPGCLLVRADAGRARGIPLPGQDGVDALGMWVRDEAALIPSGENELLTARHTPEV